MSKKDDIKKINITTYWDDFNGNMDHNDDGDESDNFIGSHRIKITGNNFKNWDPIFKLDYFTDLEEWMQLQVDEIHEKLSDNEKFTHTYMMHCPKSTKQWQAEKKEPGLETKLNDLANKTRVETSNALLGKNVVKFNKGDKQ